MTARERLETAERRRADDGRKIAAQGHEPRAATL